jgi:RNA polymerase sigma-70 factor, ECF subfamily
MMNKTTRSMTDPIAQEQDLVERLRRREADAFEELVRRHSRNLHHVARTVLRNDDDASDAVQQALISAYRGLPRFEAQSRLSTWLYRIVLNAALSLRRRHQRRQEVPLDLLHSAGLQDVVPELEAAERRIIRRQLSPEIEAALSRLPAHHRQVLELDLAGADTAMAARALGLEPHAVKLRRFRARQAVRRVLSPRLRSVVRRSAPEVWAGRAAALPAAVSV